MHYDLEMRSSLYMRLTMTTKESVGGSNNELGNILGGNIENI